jgi:hypothetical protein
MVFNSAKQGIEESVYFGRQWAIKFTILRIKVLLAQHSASFWIKQA